MKKLLYILLFFVLTNCVNAQIYNKQYQMRKSLGDSTEIIAAGGNPYNNMFGYVFPNAGLLGTFLVYNDTILPKRYSFVEYDSALHQWLTRVFTGAISVNDTGFVTLTGGSGVFGKLPIVINSGDTVTLPPLNFTLAGTLTLGYGTGNIGVATGDSNLYIGDSVGRKTTVGNLNTVIGQGAFQTNDSGMENTGLGQGVLAANKAGSYNTAIGSGALIANTSGNINTAVGEDAMASNTIGGANVSIGSLFSNTSGNSNSGVGVGSLNKNTTGSFNTAMGKWTAASINTANDMAAFGNEAARYDTGAAQTAIGSLALTHDTAGTKNTALGWTADVSKQGLSNATMIGAGAKDSVSNAIQLGDTNVTKVNTSGLVQSTAGFNLSTINGHLPLLEINGNHGTTGQELISNGTNPPNWATPVGDSAIVVGKGLLVTRGSKFDSLYVNFTDNYTWTGVNHYAPTGATAGVDIQLNTAGTVPPFTVDSTGGSPIFVEVDATGKLQTNRGITINRGPITDTLGQTGNFGQVLTAKGSGGTAIWQSQVATFYTLGNTGSQAQGGTLAKSLDNLGGVAVGGIVAGDGHQTVMPVSGQMKNLYIVTKVAPAAGQTFTFTIYDNRVATALSVVVLAGTTTINSGATSISVTQGHEYMIVVTTSATSGALTGWDGGVEVIYP